MKKCMLILMSVVASTVLADETVYPVLTTTGSTPSIGNTFYNNASNWTCDDPGVTVVPPSDPAAAAYDYLYTSSLRGPTAEQCPFYCHSFRVKEGVSYSDQKTAGVQTNDFRNAGLFMSQNSGIAAANSRFCDTVYSGLITIEGTAAKPCSFSAGQVSGEPIAKISVLRLAGKVVGDTTARMTFGTTMKGARTVIDADASEYYGEAYARSATGYLTLGCATFNGTLGAWNGAAIGTERASDCVTVSKMNISTETPYVVKTDSLSGEAGCFVVETELTQTAKLVVQPTDIFWHGKKPILKLSERASGTIDLSMFELGECVNQYREPTGISLPGAFRLETDEANTTLYLVRDAETTDFVYLEVGDPDNNGRDVVGAAQIAESWSDKELPHTNATYIIHNKRLNFDAYGGRTSYVFPAQAVYLWSDARNHAIRIEQTCRNVTITNFYLLPSATYGVNGNSTNPTYLWGDSITTYAGNSNGEIYFTVIGGKEFHIMAPISGNGRIVLTEYGTLATWGTLCLEAASPDFSGTWTFSINDNTRDKNECPTDVHCKTVRISESTSLGGALATFDYKAVSMDQMTVLQPVKSMTMDEPTRGVYVGNVARIRTDENVDFSLKNPLTLNGELRKEGVGLLALGGQLRFLDASGAILDTPRANFNKLVVAAGVLKPLSMTAFDGLAISLTDATSTLAYDLAPADADVATYGIYNVKNESDPLISSVTGGSIPVRFDGEPDRTVGVYDIGLVTVKTRALAEALKGKFVVPKVRGRTVSVDIRDNADGTATVLAKLVNKGFFVIVK